MSSETSETIETSETKATAKTRRTEGIRTRGRAARVVEDVLRATTEELGRVGYAALRVDDIATRSGVNKTTIYRRWPTKAELVASAIGRIAVSSTVPDTGSLEGDVLEFLLGILKFADTPAGPGIMRMLQVERAQPEIEAISTRLRVEHRAARAEVVRQAIERGELPPETDPDLVADLFFQPIMTRLVRDLEPVSEAYVRAVVKVVLAGVRSTIASVER
jgi:AcrR family transcriptional regulator